MAGMWTSSRATRTRRAWAGAALALTLGMAPLHAQSDARSESPDESGFVHALAISGEPGYPEGFPHFGYVNPDAPKGGTVKLSWPRSFDSFNPILPKGLPAPGLGLLYETLITSALDEQDVSAYYGLIANGVRVAPDLTSVTYRLDPDARWHDGEPIDAEDVIWSFETTRELSPERKFYWRNVTNVEETAPGEVTFTFDEAGNRELPVIVGQTIVLPKHWWEEEVEGERRIDQTRLDETPLGSGPYQVGEFAAGKSITYERVPDAWANDHPTQVGQNNFDRLTYEVFLDPTVAIQGFKKNVYDWKNVNSAKEWATEYEDFEALAQGRVIKEEFPDRSIGLMQAFVPNLRRERFQDPRVRRALNLAFDFETTQRTRFYGQYRRARSFFDGTELAAGADGPPEGREREFLEELKAEFPDDVPDAVFEAPSPNPVAGDPGRLRENMREADRLLREAGWTVENGKRVKDGEVFKLEYLESSALFEPIVLPWFNNLRRLGIETSYRFVDPSQEVERTRARDFDVVTTTFVQTLSPGNEQREYWGSEAADLDASRNVAGIKNPAIDAMIEKLIFTKDRDELTAASRALDRLLLAGEYVIPQWISDTDRTLRWDKFGHPDNLVERLNGFSVGFPSIWWYDEAKAAKADAS